MNGWLIALIVIAGIVLLIGLWYALLDSDHKHFIRTLVSQAKYLPGRYKI
jgi:hypothetical protein